MRRERRHGARPEQADARSQDAEVGAQAVALRPVCHERSSLAFQSPANEQWHRRIFQHESGDAAKQAFPDPPMSISAHHAICGLDRPAVGQRSEEHTSELQSLMRISYAVFCLQKKTKKTNKTKKQNRE